MNELVKTSVTHLERAIPLKINTTSNPGVEAAGIEAGVSFR